MELAIILSVIGTTTGVIALILTCHTHRHSVQVQNLRVAYDLYAQAIALGAEDGRWPNKGKAAFINAYDFVGRCVDENAFPRHARDYWFKNDSLDEESKELLRKYMEVERKEDAIPFYSETFCNWLFD